MPEVIVAISAERFGEPQAAPGGQLAKRAGLHCFTDTISTLQELSLAQPCFACHPSYTFSKQAAATRPGLDPSDESRFSESRRSSGA